MVKAYLCIWNCTGSLLAFTLSGLAGEYCTRLPPSRQSYLQSPFCFPEALLICPSHALSLGAATADTFPFCTCSCSLCQELYTCLLPYILFLSGHIYATRLDFHSVLSWVSPAGGYPSNSSSCFSTQTLHSSYLIACTVLFLSSLQTS